MTSQILLFDQPRSGSHLLQRMLSTQPKLHLLDNSFGPARGTQVNWLMSPTWDSGLPEASRLQFEEQVKVAETKWREGLEKVKAEGKILMLHDHPFSIARPEVVMDLIKNPETKELRGNVSLVPDDLFLEDGTVPIFGIRDPRLAVPSAYRVLKSMGLPHGSGKPNFTMTTSLIWPRILYDFFLSKGIQPLVVDGDDTMTNPDFVRGVCLKVGFDPELVYRKWQPPKEEEKAKLHPMFYASQKYLIDSSGPNPGRAAKNMDMQAEEAKWEEEFGEDVELIKSMVALAMPHYLWLHERRFKV